MMMMMTTMSGPCSSSFASAPQQGGLVSVRGLKPLTQTKGLSLRYKQPQSQGLFFKRCSSASSQRNLEGKLVSCDSSKVKPFTKCSCSSEESERGDVFAQEKDISLFTKIAKEIDVFLRFARPYPIYGSIAGIISVSLLPLQTVSDLSPAFLTQVLMAIISSSLANLYITGINQLSDIEIDKINKPFLPLASGEYSVAVGSTITTLSALISFTMGMMSNSPPLLIAIITMLSFGTAYSVDLPLMRWKKNIFLTSLYFVCVWALMLPLCYFAHAQKYILGKPLVFTKPVIFAVVFMTVMSVIIGIMKVFWSCVNVMLATYGGAVVFGATFACIPSKIITVLGHGILASILWRKAKFVETSDPSATLAFYLFIWKLFYFEYLLILFIR